MPPPRTPTPRPPFALDASFDGLSYAVTRAVSCTKQGGTQCNIPHDLNRMFLPYIHLCYATVLTRDDLGQLSRMPDLQLQMHVSWAGYNSSTHLHTDSAATSRTAHRTSPPSQHQPTASTHSTSKPTCVHPGLVTVFSLACNTRFAHAGTCRTPALCARQHQRHQVLDFSAMSSLLRATKGLQRDSQARVCFMPALDLP